MREIKDLKEHKSKPTVSQDARCTLYELVKDRPAGFSPYQSCRSSTWVTSARAAAALFRSPDFWVLLGGSWQFLTSNKVC